MGCEGFMINKAKEIFLTYASNYDRSNGKIELKIVHTMAVADVMQQLTERCAFPKRICDLAGVCAVFHDIGRFEQVKQYDTFLDHLSRDHADLGCEVLVKEHFLEFLTEREQQQVLTAIRNHNKFRIEDGLDEETLLLCKLIRDADKCDIFRVFACEEMVDTMGETYEQVAQERVTPEVYDTIFRHETVLKTIRKTGLDIWVGFLAFFFDLYFDESIAILQKQKYYMQPFERITFALPETRAQIREIRDEVEAYIASRLKNSDGTLEFYNRNAEEFSASTLHVDFSETQERFLAKLQDGARILDFGCGSGRDSKYFQDRGYEVEAVDGSAELCRLASEYTGIEVKQMLFSDLDEVERYDGIWACASILHLQKRELGTVLGKMRDALKPSGVIYASFKYGNFEGERGGRYFTNFTEGAFSEFLEEVGGLSPAECWITGDVRPGRAEEKWLNVLLVHLERKDDNNCPSDF